MRRLAVIPARGGSTRLPNKNIYPLGDKPLILWTVEAVLESNCFDKVIVSTDSEKIWEAVEHLPVERHQRPAEHATVKATALKAMINLMENLDEQYDIFAYFLPTCLFIKSSDIKKGIEMLTEDIDSVVSITEITECIQKACLVKNDWLLPVFDNLEFGLTNSKFVKVNYLDIAGKRKEKIFNGFEAVCVQHEIDHLVGTLFTSHISRLKRQMILKKMQKFKKNLNKPI